MLGGRVGDAIRLDGKLRVSTQLRLPVLMNLEKRLSVSGMTHEAGPLRPFLTAAGV